MAKDMYQKRRKEKAMTENDNQEGGKKCNQLLDINLWEYIDKSL